MPLFGALAFLTCCCGCLGCVASAVARAQQAHGVGGQPPYHHVADEEAGSTPPPSVSGDASGCDAPSPTPVPVPVATPLHTPYTGGAVPRATPVSSQRSAAATAAVSAAATADEASRMAAAIDLGQTIASGEPPAAASSSSSGGGLRGGWWAAPAVTPTDAPNAAHAPAPAAEVESLSRGRALESLTTKELKHELSAMGVTHEHCLEKSELVALLIQAEGGSA